MCVYCVFFWFKNRKRYLWILTAVHRNLWLQSWFVILLTTEEVRTHATLQTGSSGNMEGVSHVSAGGPEGRSPLQRRLHRGCRRGRLHDTSSCIRKQHGARRGHNANKDRTFLHFFRVVWAKRKDWSCRSGSCIFSPGHSKNRSTRNTEAQREPCCCRDPRRTVSSCDPTGLPGCPAAAALQESRTLRGNGIPVSWAQSQTLKRPKPQQSTPQGFNQSGLHGGKTDPVSLQRTQKRLQSSSAWLSRLVSREFRNNLLHSTLNEEETRRTK